MVEDEANREDVGAEPGGSGALGLSWFLDPGPVHVPHEDAEGEEVDLPLARLLISAAIAAAVAGFALAALYLTRPGS